MIFGSHSYSFRLVKRSIAIEMLQAQVATGGVLSPKNGDKVDIRTAVQTGLVPNDFEIHLIEAEKAFKGSFSIKNRNSLKFQAMFWLGTRTRCL